jgi:hypothetical protein
MSYLYVGVFLLFRIPHGKRSQGSGPSQRQAKSKVLSFLDLAVPFPFFRGFLNNFRRTRTAATSTHDLYNKHFHRSTACICRKAFFKHNLMDFYTLSRIKTPVASFYWHSHDLHDHSHGLHKRFALSLSLTAPFSVHGHYVEAVHAGSSCSRKVHETTFEGLLPLRALNVVLMACESPLTAETCLTFSSLTACTTTSTAERLESNAKCRYLKNLHVHFLYMYLVVRIPFI